MLQEMFVSFVWSKYPF